MDTNAIDEAIERYVNERMTAGRERAEERFLSYAYLKYTGEELADFMLRARGLTRYYIHLTRVFENPFRGREMAFLATMLVVAIASSWMLLNETTRLAGICALTGTIINGVTLLKYIADKWSRSGVMIAIYEEIVALVEHEVAATA